MFYYYSYIFYIDQAHDLVFIPLLKSCFLRLKNMKRITKNLIITLLHKYAHP